MPYHPEALELADMGLIPAGAYRNRDYAQPGVKVCAEIPLALQDIFYDPQTSGGLLIALPAEAAGHVWPRCRPAFHRRARIGYVTEWQDASIKLE